MAKTRVCTSAPSDPQHKLSLPPLPSPPPREVVIDGIILIKNPEMDAIVVGNKKKESLLWDNGEVLTIAFLNGTPIQKKKVRDVATEWLQYAVGISFEFVEGKAGYIRINFDESNESWSYVGIEAHSEKEDKQTMNFGWLKDDTSDKEYHRTVLHEFGHALGLQHEHQSPETKMKWNKPVVDTYPNMKKDDIESNIYRVPTFGSYSQFDVKSIMMYEFDAKYTTNNLSTGENDYLDGIDKTYIMRIYPRQLGEVFVGDTVRFEVDKTTQRLNYDSKNSNIKVTARNDWGTDLGRSDSRFKIVRSPLSNDSGRYSYYVSLQYKDPKNPDNDLYICYKKPHFTLIQKPSDPHDLADSSFSLKFDPEGNVNIVSYNDSTMCLISAPNGDAILGSVPSTGNFTIKLVTPAVSNLIEKQVHFELFNDPTHRLNYENINGKSILHLAAKDWKQDSVETYSWFRILPSNVRDVDFVSLQSINSSNVNGININTDYYIRHKDSHFYVEKSDGTSTFEEDSSFKLIFGDNGEVGFQLYKNGGMINLPASGDACVLGKTTALSFKMVAVPGVANNEPDPRFFLF